MTKHNFTIEIEEDQGTFRITMLSTNEHPSMRMQQSVWHPSIEEAAKQFGSFIPHILPRMIHMKTKYIQKAGQENQDE